ncbi:hypothetical protein [Nocardia sp. NBC_00416]|uniref:hypothetical protein n=1 Tax=Nocardia sp. NBC_00416 TaxID=2975991 RepID=UPI002E244E00
MSARITKIFAATVIALSLGAVAAPLASAASTPTPAPASAAADPIEGSVVICLPLGSASICF